MVTNRVAVSNRLSKRNTTLGGDEFNTALPKNEQQSFVWTASLLGEVRFHPQRMGLLTPIISSGFPTVAVGQPLAGLANAPPAFEPRVRQWKGREKITRGEACRIDRGEARVAGLRPWD